MLIMLPHWTREPALSFQAMEGPVAVACYEGQWDPSVDELHKALGFLPPPIYRSPRQKAQQAGSQGTTKSDARASAGAAASTTGTPFERGELAQFSKPARFLYARST